jgi:anaerobic selenocysteine-containing dehydrogenase
MKRVEHDEVRRSICAFDCPDACGLLGYLKDGQLVAVGGDPDHPVTRGHICAKVAFDHRRVHGPNRLTRPLKRTGAKGSGEFEPISWEEAIAIVAGAFKRVNARYGAEAILPYSYAGTMGIVNYNIGHRFFYKLGASQLRRSICSAAGNAGYMYSNGPNRGIDPEETVDSKYILAWGANLVSANVHQMALVQEARRKGAKLVVVDVHRNKTGDAADWFIPIRPGTDGALALGLMHVIVAENLHDPDWIEHHTSGFEQLQERLPQFSPERVEAISGVPAADIRRLAREYATNQPAFIRIGNGIQHHDNGGMCVRNISCLPALVGAWRHRGGGAMKSNRGYSAMNERALQRPDLMEHPSRIINMNRLGAALTEVSDPPVMAVYVYNSNPAAVAPSQDKVIRGLEREDLFVAVHDVVMTDTCRYADVVLPATTSWEHEDLYDSYWHLYAGVAQPAISPVGEAKPNIEVFQLLAQAMGFDEPCFRESAEDVMRSALDNPANECLAGVTVERLLSDGPVRVGPAAKHQPFTELYSDTMLQHGHDPLPAWNPLPEVGEGLWLITPPNHFFLNSSLAGVEELREREGRPELQISATDAAARGIADGALVRASNGRGAVELHARVTDAVQSGVVVSQGVWWPGRSRGGRGVNVTTPDREADMAGGAVFFTNKVEVQPV